MLYDAAVRRRTDEEREAAEELVLWRAMFISMTWLLNRVEGDVKAAHDLTLLDLGILLGLSHGEDEAPMGSLAATFGVDPSVITYRLKRLEARGLATRTSGAGDRRVTFAQSTAAGRASMPDALRTMLASAHRHLLSKLEPAEVPVLAKVFIRLQHVQRTAVGSVVGAARPRRRLRQEPAEPRDGPAA